MNLPRMRDCGELKLPVTSAKPALEKTRVCALHYACLVVRSTAPMKRSPTVRDILALLWATEITKSWLRPWVSRGLETRVRGTLASCEQQYSIGTDYCTLGKEKLDLHSPYSRKSAV